MKLVIVESPAKCGKIQGFLGAGYIVKASMGHIRALEETLDAVGLTTDFEPRFAFLEGKSKVQRDLKEAAKGVEQVFLAADDDREGEAIAYSVALLLKLPLSTTPRIVFHEITERAIQQAIQNPRRLHMDRIYAQQARTMLDMMIGFTISPVLWTHVARGLSAGRCQTPALKLLIDKESQIRDFKSSSSWSISGTLSVAGSSSKIQAALQDELEDEESVQNYLEGRKGVPHLSVVSNTIRPWSSSPPVPLMTSTLQQQASALFGMSPKSTMQVAQKLYEAGHITYMRTDTTSLSQEAVQEARTWITETLGAEYMGELKADGGAGGPKGSKSSGGLKADKVPEGPKAKEAHEAIRPTHIEVADVVLETTHAQKIYTLIRNRTLQSVMAKALGETCTVILHAANEEEEERLPWKAVFKRTTFDGWQRIGGKVAELEDKTEDSDGTEQEWSKGITLTVGTTVTWKAIQGVPRETKPPGRMTEAIVVRELEQKGIGRPSTFSSLISAIQERGYAEITDIPGTEIDIKTYLLSSTGIATTLTKKKVGQEKKKLVPTELGKSCLAFLEKHFASLFDYRFTAQMEGRLDKIEKGEEPWKQVLRDTWALYRGTYEELSASTASASVSASTSNPKILVLGSDGLKAVMSKKGPLLLREGASGKKEDTQFFGWPKDVLFSDMTEAVAKSFIASVTASATASSDESLNGHPIVSKTWKFGAYVLWNSISLSVKPTDSLDEIKEKLTLKAASESGSLKTFKEYEIRNGPYGPYILKTTLKKRQFVSVPKGITIDTLSEADVAALYKSGLESKSKSRAFQKKYSI